MNFVACVSWVKKGIAKEVPDKVSLSQDELKRLVESARQDVADAEEEETHDDDGNENDEDDDTMEVQDEETSDGHASDEEDITKKYGLDTYDDEDDDNVNDTANSLAALTVFPSNESDPWLDPNQVDDSDEEDNYRIRPSDNLIAVGHVEEDCSILEIYVHNTEDEEETLYVHHDIVLPAFPMCLEWLDFDPSETSHVNYIAVGDMTPVIQVWDIDLVDTLEPAYKLGKKVKKKKKAAKQKLESVDTIGHTDGVLDIKWNRFARSILASGSADHTVCLWDLNKAVPVTSLNHHTEKVQALQWHPCEMRTLLTSSCDKTVNIYDCQVPDAFKRWNVDGEVESLLWNHFDPYYFLVGTDQGFVHSFDMRTSNSIFTLKAHNDAITGMSLSPVIPGCLITASIDKTVKVWDVQNNAPQFVVEKDLKLGTLYTVACCPDAPCTIACGGDNKSNSFRVLDLRTSKPFCDHFADRLSGSNLDVRPGQQLQANSSVETTSPEASTSSGNGANISENSQTIPFPHIGKKPKVKKMKKAAVSTKK